MRKFLILAFLIVLVCGGRADAVNLVKNGDFSVDGDETGWLRFEDNSTPSEWSVAGGTANIIGTSANQAGNMYYQVVKAPIGATVTVEADWMSNMPFIGGFWAEVFFGTVEDAFAFDTMVVGKEDWTIVEELYSKPGTLWTPPARLSYPLPNDGGQFKTYGNGGEGGIAFKKDGWGMNIAPNTASWGWEDCRLSTNVPVAENLTDWNRGKLGRPTFTSVDSLGDVMVILKVGGACQDDAMVSFDNVELNVDLNDLLPGDADCDGDVDVTDLGILATNYGVTGPIAAVWGDGDFDQNGLVNVSDLGALATNYGTTAPTAVPEPSTLSLLLLGSLAMIWRRRR